MLHWLDGKRGVFAFVVVFIGLSIVGGWAYLFETLPGGVWHRNRITGATCYRTVHCWTAASDPFGKGLKLPAEPFGKLSE
ncbi:hypothetical protein [Methylocystis echinoides]|uniref:hypothetical protein n=1 Tax=Methylocystis echinoides TaxID=29468 RepID=UPI0034313149